MSGVLIVSGTDTDVGKTVVAAGLAAALGAAYWKPIQAGTAGGTDTESAGSMGVPPAQIVPEAYRLSMPASPHLAAQREGIAIEPARLALPSTRPLVVEGAGGLVVPIRLDPPWLMIDQFAAWRAPVLLVARAGLGTINHSLLSVAALRARAIAVAGLIYIGARSLDNEAAIHSLSDVPSLGCLPRLDPLNAATLQAAVAQHIDLTAIRTAMAAP